MESQFFIWNFILTTFGESREEKLEEVTKTLKELPSYLIGLLTEAIFFLIYATLFFGLFLILWGIIEWATGWNEFNGKRNVVRGVILLAIASLFAYG